MAKKKHQIIAPRRASLQLLFGLSYYLAMDGPTPEQKFCHKCDEWKPRSAFCLRTAALDGLQPFCKVCEAEYKRRYYEANREHYRERQAAWREQNKEYKRRLDRERHLMLYYGLTKQDLERMQHEQGARCAICGRTAPLVVDHDHQTNEVRSLLCQHCNTGLGCFIDSPEVLRAAAYLEPVTGEDAKRAARDGGATWRATTDALVRKRLRQLPRPRWEGEPAASGAR